MMDILAFIKALMQLAVLFQLFNLHTYTHACSVDTYIHELIYECICVDKFIASKLSIANKKEFTLRNIFRTNQSSNAPQKMCFLKMNAAYDPDNIGYQSNFTL